MPEYVIVVGAGIAGSCAALFLARRGFAVVLCESRADGRAAEAADAAASAAALAAGLGQSMDPTKRSINLALSARGRAALAAAGVEDAVLRESVRMPCRAIHEPGAPVGAPAVLQQYGRPGEAIFSASRALLSRVLLERCESEGGGESGANEGGDASFVPAPGRVRFLFSHKLKSVAADGAAIFEGPAGREVVFAAPGLIIGADGAYSAVRASLLRLSRADFTRAYIAHGYKELTMPPVATAGGGAGGAGSSLNWALAPAEALHIWPRHDFMMIALPNPDRSFTCTLFAPWATLDALDASPAAMRAFFERHFADALPHLPALEAQFAAAPSSALVTTRTQPWTALGGRLLLLGDAAHAVVPFYGQGANAALEDCLVLDECLAATSAGTGGNYDLRAAAVAFSAARKPATDALADLSLANYVEMRHKTATLAFRLRARLEAALHAVLPSHFTPLYSMVAFGRLPYDEVVRRAARQDAALDALFAAAAATTVLAASSLIVTALRSGAGKRFLAAVGLAS